MRAFEKGLDKLKKTVADAKRDLKIPHQNYYAWKVRGIPAAKIRRCARYINADPDQLEHGRYVPLEAAESPRTAGGKEIGFWFENAPSEWQERVRFVLNDYLRVEAPDVGRYLGKNDLKVQHKANRVIEAAQRLTRRKPESE